MSSPYALEEQVAISAVRRACSLTSSVFNKLVKNETLVKGDKSPVTVGDFAAQALISTILSKVFPHDPIVGEEDASDLRLSSPAAREMKEKVVGLANEALTLPILPSDHPLAEKVENWGDVGVVVGEHARRTDEELLDAIDRGNYEGGRSGRMWTIDPIDGTKGFLRGEQYAVCLALLVDARVQLGVIGCPNLPFSSNEQDGQRGCIFVAVRGQGARQISLSSGHSTPISIPPSQEGTLNFLESVEAAHASHSFNARVSELLGITRTPNRMDSQAKYGCLARGDGGAYLRMPTGVGYKEKIWDHAGGSLLVEEAGGVVTDSRGQPLDFGLGRTLGENFGVVAAGKDVHPKILEAIRKAKEEGL